MTFDLDAAADEAALEDHERRIVRCRDQACRARIVWLTLKGRPHPTDADTVEVGDTELDAEKGHVSHFATCPAAGKLRRPR